MEIIKRKTDYGLRALARLAVQPRGELLLAKQLSEEEGIPANFLHKILQELHQGGLVRAHRGRGGGFSLAKSPSEITIRQVMEILQGPVAINRCLMGENACPRQEVCELREIWVALQSQLLHFFERVTLRQLAGLMTGSAAPDNGGKGDGR